MQAALAGGETATFACDGTIIVPEIDITQDTVLDATGRDVTLSGNNANRVLRVNPGNALTVKGLTIADCQIANLGAGISFRGSGVLRIINSTLQDNVSSASGAGLFLDPDPKADGTFAVHVSTSEPLTSWPTLTKIRSRWTKTRKSGSQILRSNPQRKGGLISI